MYIEIGNITFYISFSFAVFLAVAANTSVGRTYLLSLICAFLHEGVHVFFLKKCGCRKILLKFSFGGIKMQTDGFSLLSYKNTVLCTVSAPIVNIITGALFYCLFFLFRKEAFYIFAVINLITGAVNLLPLPFLDGGRTLAALLAVKYEEHETRRICDILAVISLVFLGGIFAVTLFMKKYVLFLMFFFFYCTLGYINDKLT